MILIADGFPEWQLSARSRIADRVVLDCDFLWKVIDNAASVSWVAVPSVNHPVNHFRQFITEVLPTIAAVLETTKAAQYPVIVTFFPEYGPCLRGRA